MMQNFQHMNLEHMTESESIEEYESFRQLLFQGSQSLKESFKKINQINIII